MADEEDQNDNYDYEEKVGFEFEEILLYKDVN